MSSPSTKDLGTKWLRRMATAVLSVPSAVVNHERSYLLNPKHPDFKLIEFRDPRAFVFDPRLKETNGRHRAERRKLDAGDHNMTRWELMCAAGTLTAIFLPLMIVMIAVLSGERWEAMRDKARERRMAEHRLNARLLRMDI